MKLRSCILPLPGPYLVLFFLYVYPQHWTILFSFWLEKLNISYWIGLLATDFLSFCLSKKVFVFPPLLKNNYTRCRLLMLHFYFNILNISLHSLLVCLFSGEKFAVILFLFPPEISFLFYFCFSLFYPIYTIFSKIFSVSSFLKLESDLPWYGYFVI